MQAVEDLLGEELTEFVPYTVLNIYLVGSHLFGVAKANSDQDFVCIVQTQRHLPGIKYVERGDINLAIYHYDTFTSFVSENVVWMVMLLFVPTENVFKQTMLPEFRLRKIDLQRVALLDSRHLYAKAKRLFRTDAYTAKKDLVHGIRFLCFAIQLATRHKIVNFDEGNAEWRVIMGRSVSTWEELEKEVLPLYTRLEEELIALTTCALPEPTPSSPLVAIDWMNHYGAQSLSEELNVNIVELSDGLLLLHSDRYHSPRDHPIIQQCGNGLLVRRRRVEGEGKEEYEVVGYPYHKIAKIECKRSIFGKAATRDSLEMKQERNGKDEKKGKRNKKVKTKEKDFLVDRIPWESVRAFKLDSGDEGRTVTVYYDGEGWRCYVADGVETILCSSLRPRSKGSEDDEDKEGGYYYHFPSPSFYNPYLFFEETLSAQRDTYVENMMEYLSGTEKERKEIGEAEKGSLSFYELFWAAWKRMGYQLPSLAETHLCFTFEVNLRVLHKTGFGEREGSERDRIVLFGVREVRDDFQEIEEIGEYTAKYGWESITDKEVKAEDVGGGSVLSFESVMRWVYRVEDTFGLLLRFRYQDGEIQRVRVLSPQFLALKKLFWTSSTTEPQQQQQQQQRLLILEIVKTNDNNRFLFEYPYPASWRSLYTEVRAEFESFCAALLKIVANGNEGISGEKGSLISQIDRKEFGRIASRYRFRELLFEIYATNNECSMREYLAFLPVEVLHSRMHTVLHTHTHI